jgi:hypothetical protein
MGRGPRRPDNADITVTVRVRARQLRFGEVPQISTDFTGTPGHESASGSDRANLPERVEKDMTYRHVRVDYWLAAALRYPSASVALVRTLRSDVRVCSVRARKTAKSDYHQPSLLRKVRREVANASPDHGNPARTTPRSTRAPTRSSAWSWPASS